MIRTPRFILMATGLGLVALAACTATVPDSGSGVGFQDYNSYIRGAQAAPAAPLSSTGLPAAPLAPTGFDPANAAAAIDRAEGRLPVVDPGVGLAVVDPAAPQVGALVGAPLDPNRPRGNQPAGIAEQTGETDAARARMSDENDFEAVKARETIESDKARIERNRSQYVVVQPGALPTRQGDEGPNIVQYALSTTNVPGTAMYPRRSLVRKDPVVACAKFGSPDLAQEQFLRAGGPEKDKAGVDPDGDGFACDWDPRPFRTALN